MRRSMHPKSRETPGCRLSDDRLGVDGSHSANNNNKNNDRRDADAPHFRRRGMAIVGFVAALLIIGTFLLWLFQLTATTATSSLSHYFGTGAFYAAESGLEMSLRELNLGKDIDEDKINSDGTIGTISDNGNPSDDPTLVSGAVFVQKVSTSPAKYRATGRPAQTTAPWSNYRRIVEARIE